MYIAPGRDRKPPGDKMLMSTERPYHFVASFKEISLKSDFVHFFSLFNTCIYPRGRSIQPPGDKVLMSTETPCPFDHLLPVSNHRRQ